jgi:hypothetical protein
MQAAAVVAQQVAGTADGGLNAAAGLPAAQQEAVVVHAGVSSAAGAASLSRGSAAGDGVSCIYSGSSSVKSGNSTSAAAAAAFFVSSQDGGSSSNSGGSSNSSLQAAAGLAGSASGSNKAAAEWVPGLAESHKLVPSAHSSPAGSSSSSSRATASATEAQVQPCSSTAAAAAVHGQGLPAAGAGACGVLTRSKQKELQQQIDAGKATAAGMQQQLDDLQQQVRHHSLNSCNAVLQHLKLDSSHTSGSLLHVMFSAAVSLCFLFACRCSGWLQTRPPPRSLRWACWLAWLMRSRH